MCETQCHGNNGREAASWTPPTWYRCLQVKIVVYDEYIYFSQSQLVVKSLFDL